MLRRFKTSREKIKLPPTFLLLPKGKISGQCGGWVLYILTSTLDQCGLISAEIGNTFQADHTQTNGTVSEIVIDHVCHGKVLNGC